LSSKLIYILTTQLKEYHKGQENPGPIIYIYISSKKSTFK